MALMASALIPSAAPARSSQKTETVRRDLGALNIVKGRNAASIPVRLKQPATMRVPEFNKGAVTAKGEGRLVGFALAQAPFDLDESSTLFATRVLIEGGNSEVLSLGFALRQSKKGYHLPAGNYELYLITDGKPSTVKFKLDGVSGTRRFNPTSPADLKVKSPEIQLDDAASNIYSGGGDSQLRGDGLLFSHLWVRTDVHATSVSQFCYTAGSPEPADHPAPYAPGCPSANEKYFYTQPATFVSAEPDLIHLYGGSNASTARWGQGFSHEAGGVVDGIGYTALWLNLS